MGYSVQRCDRLIRPRRGCSLMVEHELPKLIARVRFPSSALERSPRSATWGFVVVPTCRGPSCPPGAPTRAPCPGSRPVRGRPRCNARGGPRGSDPSVRTRRANGTAMRGFIRDRRLEGGVGDRRSGGWDRRRHQGPVGASHGPRTPACVPSAAGVRAASGGPRGEARWKRRRGRSVPPPFPRQPRAARSPARARRLRGRAPGQRRHGPRVRRAPLPKHRIRSACIPVLAV